MSRPGPMQGSPRGSAAGSGGGRPGLIPANPMPLSRAIIQVVLLLGIPLTILVLCKLALQRLFPELGS